MLKIITYPNPVLRKVAQEVKQVDAQTQEEMLQLKSILESGDNAVGLAAVQLGVEKRFFGLKNVKTGVARVMINPKIEDNFGAEKSYFQITNTETKKEENFLEGCLSIPQYYGTVKRWFKIKASWQEMRENGLSPRIYLVMNGYGAIVFQHELDHLNGVLFIDHVQEEGGELFVQKGKEMVACDIDSLK